MSIQSENKMIKTYDTCGNVASATFAINYNKLEKSGMLRKGDKILGCFAGSGLVTGQLGYTY